ncbi:MAG: hypothetical protein ACLVKT_15165, partial [Intestinibacter bartlettii]|uniref:hypothetical protein n=2 Tax=Peptostreptococcales TaxID=3082720 RepID=UPI00399B7A7B
VLFMLNTENFLDTINQLANDGIKTKEDICKYLKIEIRDFMALIKSNNLHYSKKEGRYIPKEDTPTKTNDIITLEKVTYRIPKHLNDTLKLQCIIEDTTATDIVIKALEGYLPQSTKDTLKQIKK